MVLGAEVYLHVYLKRGAPSGSLTVVSYRLLRTRYAESGTAYQYSLSTAYQYLRSTTRLVLPIH